jgi:hypothetical protein
VTHSWDANYDYLNDYKKRGQAMYRFWGIVLIVLLVNGCSGRIKEDLSEVPSYMYPARKVIVDTKNPFTSAERAKARTEARLSGASLLFEIVANSDHEVLSVRTSRLKGGLIEEGVMIIRREIQEDVYPLIMLLPGQDIEQFRNATTAFFYSVFLDQEIDFW